MGKEIKKYIAGPVRVGEPINLTVEDSKTGEVETVCGEVVAVEYGMLENDLTCKMSIESVMGEFEVCAPCQPSSVN